MKSTILTSILAIALAISVYQLTASSPSSEIPPEVHSAFSKWKLENKRLYSSPKEDTHRLSVFYNNYKLVKETNSKQSSYELGLNLFADLSLEEFRAKYTGDLSDEEYEQMEQGDSKDLDLNIPSSHDWTSAGGVNPVTNQLSCGSCWSFASTAAFEWSYWKKTGSLYKFSEQHLVDCDTNSQGCNGGLPAYKFLMSTGAVLNSQYPYKAAKNYCSSGSLPKYKATSYISYTNTGADNLKSYIYNYGVGNVGVYVNSDFQLYKGGVLDSRVYSTSTNHAVNAVGYGSDWVKIRNSWSTSWGESGYIRLRLTSDSYGTTAVYKRFVKSVV